MYYQVALHRTMPSNIMKKRGGNRMDEKDVNGRGKAKCGSSK